MAAGRSSSVEPSGRPQTARSCCSNWLVTEASNVRCPELCGRGASSLTSRRRRASGRTRRTARRPRRAPRATPAASRTTSRADALADPRRRHRHVEDVMAVAFSIGPPVDEGAVEAARRDHRDLALEIDEGLEDRRAAPPACCHASAASAGERDAILALAVVAKARRLQDGGAAELREAAPRAPSSERTATNGVTGKPAFSRNVFSRRRCCVVCRTRARRAGPAPPRRPPRPSPAGTFSNSKVTTLDARERTAAPRRGRRRTP